jgi:hypothetical protein
LMVGILDGLSLTRWSVIPPTHSFDQLRAEIGADR